MSNHDSTPKKSRQEPVIIPLSLVDEGCRRIAENILELTDLARRSVVPDEEIVGKRMVQILVMHAMDEAGKLLEVVRKTIEAELTGVTAISIEGFYSHPRKGSQAGEMGMLAIDWLESTVEGFPDLTAVERANLREYRIHLKELKESFSKYREALLYVDFDGTKWSSPTARSELMVFFDASSIGVLATLCLEILNASRPIHDLGRIARMISDSTTLMELKKKLEEDGNR